MRILKPLRQTVALASLLAVTILLTDPTHRAWHWLGWLARIQFLPALLALDLGVLVFLVALTLVFGRIYCSVVCPLGILQDGFAFLGRRSRKNRYSWSQPRNLLRYGFLALTAAAAAGGVMSFVALLAPYSSFGRMARAFVAPVAVWVNNLLASWAESRGSYAFAREEYLLAGTAVAGVAAATLLLLAVLAWRNGRTYCNTVCPVGTVLGFLSRFSLLRPAVDRDKCNSCGLCARNCKAACIDSGNKTIDRSRCVTCFNCVSTCRRGAIEYTWRRSAAPEPEVNAGADASRRRALFTITGLAVAAAGLKAEKTVDGGLAKIAEKKNPARKTKIVPPGGVGIRNLERHCTACQLCVSACPNQVLRPSAELASWMQPESGFERGYCRPECNACSQVCPTGAIRPIGVDEKSSVQVGHAVISRRSCIACQGEAHCGNCARHCPTGAISMVERKGHPERPARPVVNAAKCIGCGACENLCPVRPYSAIHVEGHEIHRTV